MAPPGLNLADVQGLVYNGYRKHGWAGYVFARLEGDCGAAARAWLRGIHVASATKDDTNRATPIVNVAFGPRGLAALGLDPDAQHGLPQELVEGMATRGRVLDETPDDWELGKTNRLDVIVLVFAATQDDRRDAIQRVCDDLATFAIEITTELAWEFMTNEHFGFADGLSNPFVPGLHDQPRKHEHPIALGEILLGYPNGYDKLPVGPRTAEFDLGANGTYLVFRKLAQDVRAFWRYLGEQSHALELSPQFLAAKIVGRWPNGTPITLSPNGDTPVLSRANDFGYLEHDKDGLHCPVAAHIRRANPRDARDGDAETSLAVVDRHRILRRGRSWGPPISIDDALHGRGDDGPRGLYFIGLGASIARGFEFIQQTWLNNPGFHGLAGERDPIIGSGGCPFTIPGDPLRTRLQKLPRVVTNLGGGYFFMPSLAAIRRLAR